MTKKDKEKDLLNEISEIKRMVKDVRDQMQELRQGIAIASNPVEELRVSEPYEHPWHQYQRQQFTVGGDNQVSSNEKN